MSSRYQRLFILFTRSIKITPGSAQSQVLRMMVSHSAEALTVSYTLPSKTRSKPSLLITASMKVSVTKTLVLKLTSLLVLFLAVTYSRISGWSTLRQAICAPLRCPAEAMVPHTESKIPMKETGPEALLSRLLIGAPLGRIPEKS